MPIGSGRRVGAWGMAAGAILVVAGVWVLTLAAYALQAQARQLDPSQSRMAATGEQGALGLVVAIVGALIFLSFAIAFLVGSSRARRRGPVERLPGIVAAVAGLSVLLALLFALLAPQGPLQVTTALAAGGGEHAVELRTYNGTLTAATVNGVPTAEATHDIDLVTNRGAIRIRMGSGGAGVAVGDVVAIAILEAPDRSGGWYEVARTSPTKDSTVDVPTRTYNGNLRARVQIADNQAGQVQYLLAFSFAPET